MNEKGMGLIPSVFLGALVAVMLLQAANALATFTKAGALGRAKGTFERFKKELGTYVADPSQCRSLVQGKTFDLSPTNQAAKRISDLRLPEYGTQAGVFFAESGRPLARGLVLSELSLSGFRAVAGIPNQVDTSLNVQTFHRATGSTLTAVFPLRLQVTATSASTRRIDGCAPPPTASPPSALSQADLSAFDTFVIDNASWKDHAVSSDGATCGETVQYPSRVTYAFCTFEQYLYQDDVQYRNCQVSPQSATLWRVGLSGCSHNHIRCVYRCYKRRT